MKGAKALFDGMVTQGFSVMLYEAELTCRMMEFLLQIERAPDTTAHEVLEEIKTKNPQLAAMVEDMQVCSKIAMTYFAECVAAGTGSGKMEMGRVAPSEVTKQ